MTRSIFTTILGLQFVAFSLLCADKTSFALSFPLPLGEKALSFDEDLFTKNYDFNGIVELSNCSGSLIRYEQSDLDDKAVILTNGHCVDLIKPNIAYYKRESRRRFTLLNSRGRTAGRVYASMLEYATMTQTDIALYTLQKTYRQIEDQYSVEALTLSSERPATGDEIEIISGYWHRGYSCSIEEQVYRLKEDKWTFHDSLRYSRPGCKTIGGTSGSPVILTGTKTVVAINNTGNESGRECTLNNPCEVDEDGNVFYQKGYSYAQQTNMIYTCLDDELHIDLELDGCKLPKGAMPLKLVKN
ncbi:MAG: trypsin-like peptidase domain-containing protein [Oligoflexales bacterium]|nr:trypsin-like peptidase domain-containing protein [Oligoflexales bacterium]